MELVRKPMLDPFKLPEWFVQMVIVLLSIGFIIAVIVSWIYDVHPEGGVVKTESAEEAEAENIPKTSNSRKIASHISFVVIVALIVQLIYADKNILWSSTFGKEILIRTQ